MSSVNIDELTEKIENFFVDKIKIHHYFTTMNDTGKAIWVEENFTIGEIYTFDKTGVALNGTTGGWLFQHHTDGTRTGTRFDVNENFNFLYLGLENEKSGNGIYCGMSFLTFLHDNTKYHVNVNRALNFKKVKSES